MISLSFDKLNISEVSAVRGCIYILAGEVSHGGNHHSHYADYVPGAQHFLEWTVGLHSRCLLQNYDVHSNHMLLHARFYRPGVINYVRYNIEMHFE